MCVNLHTVIAGRAGDAVTVWYGQESKNLNFKVRSGRKGSFILLHSPME